MLDAGGELRWQLDGQLALLVLAEVALHATSAWPELGDCGQAQQLQASQPATQAASLEASACQTGSSAQRLAPQPAHA